MLWLKQSTAVTFQLGPFVDKDDGVTPETGLATNMDNATTGIRVSKNGVASIDRNSATVPAHDDDGYYRVELSTTDTNTLGTLHVQYEELGVTLPAWKDFMVVPANVWDSFFGADALQVHANEITADLITAAAIATDAVNEIARAIGIRKNTAKNDIEFLMIDSTDDISGKTGLTITATRSIDGAAFGAITGSTAEVANGIYQLDA